RELYSLSLHDALPIFVEIANVSVLRRRIDFTLIATAAGKPAKQQPQPPKIQPNPRVALQKQKRAGRDVERAQSRRLPGERLRLTSEEHTSELQSPYDL